MPHTSLASVAHAAAASGSYNGLPPVEPLLKFLHPPLISSDSQKMPDTLMLSAVTAQREQNQCRHTKCIAQYALVRMQREILYSGKLRIMFKKLTVARWVWFPLIRRRGFRLCHVHIFNPNKQFSGSAPGLSTL